MSEQPEMKSSIVPGNLEKTVSHDPQDDMETTDSSSDSSDDGESEKPYHRGDVIVVALSEVDFRKPVESNEDKLVITVLKLLGVGYDGFVYKVSDNLSNEISALKIFNRTVLLSPDDYDADGTRKEIKYLRKMDHPHIVSFKATFQKSFKLFLMTEFCKYGSWKEFKRARRTFTEGEGKVLFTQLLSAVRHMHSNGLAHNDLWSANILFTDNADRTGISLKISDFGAADEVDAPSAKGFEVDLRLLTYFLDEAVDISKGPEDPSGRSVELQDLSEKLMSLIARRRVFSFKEYVNHPWLASSVPFPKTIPVSALKKAPEFTDLSVESSNQFRMEMFIALGIHELISEY